MNVKRILASLATAGVLASGSLTAFAQDSTTASAEASRTAIAGSGMIVRGSAELVRAGASFVVAGISVTSDTSVIVLRDLASGSQTSVRIAADVVRAVSIDVGDTVSAVAETTGVSLIAGGRLVAFIPNEVGRALVYTARSTQM
jgi:hypothetical protein